MKSPLVLSNCCNYESIFSHNSKRLDSRKTPLSTHIQVVGWFGALNVRMNWYQAPFVCSHCLCVGSHRSAYVLFEERHLRRWLLSTPRPSNVTLSCGRGWTRISSRFGASILFVLFHPPATLIPGWSAPLFVVIMIIMQCTCLCKNIDSQSPSFSLGGVRPVLCVQGCDLRPARADACFLHLPRITKREANNKECGDRNWSFGRVATNSASYLEDPGFISRHGDKPCWQVFPQSLWNSNLNYATTASLRISSISLVMLSLDTVKHVLLTSLMDRK